MKFQVAQDREGVWHTRRGNRNPTPHVAMRAETGADAVTYLAQWFARDMFLVVSWEEICR